MDLIISSSCPVFKEVGLRQPDAYVDMDGYGSIHIDMDLSIAADLSAYTYQCPNCQFCHNLSSNFSYVSTHTINHLGKYLENGVNQ